MSKQTITIEEVQRQRIQQTVAQWQGENGGKRLDYVFPISSIAPPFWRVVLNGLAESDHLVLSDAIAAYNAG